MDANKQSATSEIDDIIQNTVGWRGDMLAQLRTVITHADPGVTEAVKWKKPSKPEGIPVWTYGGKNICMADTLKNAVRLTFPKGAAVQDPAKLFNTRLDSKTVRAIDCFENDNVDTAALTGIIRSAIELERS